MSRCTFYRLHVQAIRPAVKAPAVKTPWCAHPQSNVSVFAAAGTVGGARLLQCGGDFGKCDLPLKPESDLTWIANLDR